MYSDPWEWVANEYSNPWNCLMLGIRRVSRLQWRLRAQRTSWNEGTVLRVQEKKVSRVCWQNVRHVCTEKEEGRVAEVAFLIFRGVLISPRAENAQQYDRSWSGGCIVLEQIWGDTPCPRAKEKPQKDGRRSKIMFRINPISDKDAQRAQTSLVHTRTQRPHRDWDRTVFECLPSRYGSEVTCHKGGDSGCGRPGYGISPLGRGCH